MTHKEALFILGHGSDDRLKKCLEAIDVVEAYIKKLEEKQIPKKVKELKNIYPHGQSECPCCGSGVTICRTYKMDAFGEEITVVRGAYKYCPDCGQALDWSE